MKKLLFALILFSSGLFAQSGWVQIYSDGIEFDDIKFSNPQTGFACGVSGKILKTTNGGNNWIIIPFNHLYALTSIASITDNIWYIASFQGKFFRTTNAGISWDTTNTGGGGINKISFINANTGYAVCKYFHVLKTTDGGSNWTITNYNSSQNWSICFINENTGFAGGNKTFKTTNGGLTWDSLSLGFNFYSVDIKFIDMNTGFIAGITQNGVILKTTNQGLNWSTHNFPGSFYEDYALDFINSNTGWAITDTAMFKTIDGGESYFQIESMNDPLYSMCFTDALTGYCVSYNGAIMKTTDGGGNPIGIQTISNEIPKSFSLSQNYPNPFNPSTKIKFEIPSVGQRYTFDTKLIIYDVLGREVTTSVNESLKPGSYEVDWNGSSFASGIYFYSLVTDNFAETKKMVLIK